jgi:glycosyltransferase involved in cell wall biosynthesis
MATPLRVTFVCHSARVSGAELEVLRFVETAEGVEATVILAERGPMEQRLSAAGASVEVLPLPERTRAMKRADVRAGPGVARHSSALSRRLRDIAPDIVSVVSLKAGVYGTLAARLARVPSVWHLHDQLDRSHLAAQAVRPLRLFVATVPSAIVAPSRAPLAALGRLRPGIRTAVIPVPVPMPPEPLPIRPSVRRVGMVGRLAPWKGQHVFLRAFAEAFPSDETIAVVIGAAMFDEDAYADELHALARQLGIAERVEFRGFRSDIEAELERLDLLVHASTLVEPFGNAAFEGLAAGLPVIAADSVGPGEYIRHGRDGLPHQPGNVEELAAAMRSLASDGDLRARLAAAGRATAAQFAPAAATASLVRFYRSVALR